MSKYTDQLGAVSPTTGGVKRVADIVAALTPPPSDPAHPGIPVKRESVTGDLGRVALSMTPGLLGGGVGAVAWKKHRVLGFLAGHALGDAAHPLYEGDYKRAFSALGVEGAAVAGALAWKRHPILGWFAGFFAAGAAASCIRGTGARDILESTKKWYRKGK